MLITPECIRLRGTALPSIRQEMKVSILSNPKVGTSILNFFLISLLILFSGGDIMGSHSTGTEFVLESLIPEGFKDLNRWGKAQIFNRQNLFDHIDGGAELYLSYDFQRLLVQEYKVGDRLITVEIYLFKTSPDAFGLYSLDQEGENHPIGDKANYNSGLLKFWKGNYFVRIIDLSGNDQFKEETLELGRKISDRISEKGELPRILSRLPAEGLVPGSERFFHKQIVLNNLYFLSTENLLNLSEKTSAVMGDYLLGKMNLKLLLISYPDSSIAKSSFENFCTKYLKTPSSGKRVIQKVEEDKFIGLELEKKYIWLIFEGRDEKNTGNILQKVKKRIKGD